MTLTTSQRLSEQLKEEWRDIIGFEGLYEVSNHGRVKSKRRCGAAGGLMKLATGRKGYKHISLTKGNKAKKCSVHRLVLSAFVGYRTSNFQANHLDGNTSNNFLWNLEWCTRQENMRHSLEVLGNTRIGEKNGNHKVTDREARLLMILKSKYPDIKSKEVAGIFGVSTTEINLIWSGKRFKHLLPSQS